ncbi:MAG: hypothetical protein ACREBC_30345 [Pyrinomonadaceae bacterium]
MATTLDEDITPGTVQDTYAEGQRYFMGQGTLNNTLAQLAADLKKHGIDYMQKRYL